jgi:hypothetical protein
MATPHRFADLLAKRDSSPTIITLPQGTEATILGPAMRGEYFRPANAVTYCPKCIGDEGYHRLSWLPRLAACCPIHGCLLIERCIGCDRDLRVDDITSGRCRECGRRLAGANTLDLNDDELGLAANRLLYNCWQGYEDAYLSQRFALPDIPAPVLFELIIGLVRAVTYIGSDFKLLHRCGPLEQLEVRYIRQGNSPSQAFSLVATAFKAVKDWPMGFEDFLEAYRSHSSQRSSGQVRTDFGFFYTRILEQYWNTNEMEFAQKAFYRYVATTYVPNSGVTTLRRYRADSWFRSQFPYLNISQAAERLKTTEREVRLLAKRGHISSVKANRKGSCQWLISKRQIDSLCELWGNGVTLQQIALIENTNIGDIAELAREGLIAIIDESDSCQTAGDIVVDGRSYTKLRSRLHAKASPPSDNCETMTIAEAAERLWQDGFGIARTVRRMLAGEIRFMRRGAGLLDLVLVAEDVEAVMLQIEGKSRMLPIDQFGHVHRLKPLVLLRLIESGTLEYLQDEEYELWITDEAWNRFRTEYLYAAEAARFLNCSTACIYSWTRRGILQTVPFPKSSVKMPYLYPREALATFRDAHKMSLAQIEARFKVPRELIISLVEEGRIRSLSEIESPDVNSMKFLRADIEPLVDSLLKQRDSQLNV